MHFLRAIVLRERKKIFSSFIKSFVPPTRGVANGAVVHTALSPQLLH